MKNITLKTLLIILTVLSLSTCSEVPKQDLMFFFFESCPSCDEYKLAEEYAGQIDQLNRSKKWNTLSRNLINPEAAKELKTVLSEKGLPDISRSLPLLIIGDEYINGYEAIGLKLDELLESED